jgi:hypothetical protein
VTRQALLIVCVQGGLNERGETRAQALASEYRSSPVNLSPRDGALSSASSQTFSSSEQSKDLLAKRKSVASSNLDAMTYVDENYNIYRSPRMKNGDQFNDNASLVDHAAAPAGASRRMADLGAYLFGSSDFDVRSFNT